MHRRTHAHARAAGDCCQHHASAAAAATDETPNGWRNGWRPNNDAIALAANAGTPAGTTPAATAAGFHRARCLPRLDCG
eukprot:359928-Chlamydomonas_euryale.AAC.4